MARPQRRCGDAAMRAEMGATSATAAATSVRGRTGKPGDGHRVGLRGKREARGLLAARAESFRPWLGPGEPHFKMKYVVVTGGACGPLPWPHRQRSAVAPRGRRPPLEHALPRCN